MEGFFHRIWKDKGIDKVSLLAHGIFIVRFYTEEDRNKILAGGYVFFDKKPLIMKPWNAHDKFYKENLSKVPVWIQISNLDIKYWGLGTMRKILAQVGCLLKQDQATRNRDRLVYARVMIEVSLNQELPEQIAFEDEVGEAVYLNICYEWKPIICKGCKRLGHSQDQCKKGIHKDPKWIPKVATNKVAIPEHTEEAPTKKPDLTKKKDKEVIVQPLGNVKLKNGIWQRKSIKEKNSEDKEDDAVQLSNKYQALNVEAFVELQVGQILCEMLATGGGGGIPPEPDG
ncbi:uncharacterized protein LOC133829127 [Humulus lupulus]|uniref:uncharacterized protein LOC133829127 n=1 Tax=Humulus lupulus TaxID=3486 RepID=UPI002B40BD43|nr:uncharacterized protein LOC133829127 [Humulus lupulus]